MSDFVGNDTEITDRQKRAIPFLAAGSSIREGCRLAKIRTETFYAWLKNPVFEQVLKAQRDVLYREALQTLSASVQSAVDTLVKLLRSDNESLQRSCANDILGHVLKYRELSEIEERLETVERIVLERRTYR